MDSIRGLPRAFGRVLQKERTRQGLTQEQLGEAIESGNVYICLLENGQRQPSLNAVLLLAAKLGIPAEELVRRVCVELEKGTDAAP